MVHENSHVTDQDLLLAADGELSGRRAAVVRAHLASCWPCRARMAEVEETILDLVRVHRQTLDRQFPSIAGPRALLRAQLAELAAKPVVRTWPDIFHSRFARLSAAYLGLALFVGATVFAIVVGQLRFSHANPPNSGLASAAPEAGIFPNRKLTPGATRQVSLQDVCSMAHEEVVVDVPVSLRQEILHAYGIASGRAAEYEIDYLIAPGLGGTEDVRNLWPEPYTTPTWNARVKDTLEEHLHELVCSGQVNLSTAQRDIASDWIAAYKKYLHTDTPLTLNSDLGSYTFPSQLLEAENLMPQGGRELSIIVFAF
jgi:anti-sigma factor RsiW